jgi:hypothetical protein
MTYEETCYRCEEPVEGSPLHKCPVCHKWFCEEHGYTMSGRSFCSSGCAQYFFFSEPDD